MIRDLIRHSAAYTVASMLSRGTVIVWLLVLPAFLSSSEYGVLGLLTTFAALFNILVPLEITQALARYSPAAEPAERRALASTAWLFTLAMMALWCAAVLVFARQLAEAYLGGATALVPLALAWLACNCAFYFLQCQQRWEFRARQFVIASLIFSLVTLAATVGLAATMAKPLTGVVIGQAIGAAAGLAYALRSLVGSLGGRLSMPRLGKLLRFALPLVPASLAVIASTYANRFILVRLLGLEEVGLFTWATQLAAIPAITVVGVQAALTPLVMRNLDDAATPPRLARLFEAVIAAELCLCALLVLAAPHLIDLLGYHQFAAAPALIALAAPGLLLLQLYVFFPGFAASGRTGLQLAASLIGALTVLLNWPLIAAFGVTGAASGTLLTGTVFLLAWAGLADRFYAVRPRIGRLALFVALVGAALYVCAVVPAAGSAVLFRIAAVLILPFAAVAMGLAPVSAIRTLLTNARHLPQRPVSD